MLKTGNKLIVYYYYNNNYYYYNREALITQPSALAVFQAGSEM